MMESALKLNADLCLKSALKSQSWNFLLLYHTHAVSLIDIYTHLKLQLEIYRYIARLQYCDVNSDYSGYCKDKHFYI